MGYHSKYGITYRKNIMKLTFLIYCMNVVGNISIYNTKEFMVSIKVVLGNAKGSQCQRFSAHCSIPLNSVALISAITYRIPKYIGLVTFCCSIKYFEAEKLLFYVFVTTFQDNVNHILHIYFPSPIGFTGFCVEENKLMKGI